MQGCVFPLLLSSNEEATKRFTVLKRQVPRNLSKASTSDMGLAYTRGGELHVKVSLYSSS